jgi:hypothetical protein
MKHLGPAEAGHYIDRPAEAGHYIDRPAKAGHYIDRPAEAGHYGRSSLGEHHAEALHARVHAEHPHAVHQSVRS